MLSCSASRRQRRVDRGHGRLTAHEPHILRQVARVLLLPHPNVCLVPALVHLDLLLPVSVRSAVTPPIRRGVSRDVAELTNHKEGRAELLQLPPLLLPLLHSHTYAHHFSFASYSLPTFLPSNIYTQSKSTPTLF